MRTYKPRVSSYARAHQVIVESYRENGNKPLDYVVIERKIKCTPGLMFADGVSIEDVLETLQVWRLLARIKPVDSAREVYVPLSW